GTGIGIVAAMLGYTHCLSLLYALPVIALTGFAFSSLGMVVTALAPSYDYFIFYQTLVIARPCVDQETRRVAQRPYDLAR
ncbi:hypothetical protein ACC735_39525, partial [Rhizobium ruizarguesonis]